MDISAKLTLQSQFVKELQSIPLECRTPAAVNYFKMLKLCVVTLAPKIVLVVMSGCLGDLVHPRSVDGEISMWVVLFNVMCLPNYLIVQCVMLYHVFNESGAVFQVLSDGVAVVSAVSYVVRVDCWMVWAVCVVVKSMMVFIVMQTYN